MKKTTKETNVYCIFAGEMSKTHVLKLYQKEKIIYKCILNKNEKSQLRILLSYMKNIEMKFLTCCLPVVRLKVCFELFMNEKKKKKRKILSVKGSRKVFFILYFQQNMKMFNVYFCFVCYELAKSVTADKYQQ